MNLTLIEEACDRALKEKVFKGFIKGHYVTVYEYQAKLRDAMIKLSFDAFSGGIDKPQITISCESTERPGKEIYPPLQIKNPLDAYSEAQNIWSKVCASDKAKVGNLDDFKYFDYLDHILQWAYYLRKSELERGMLMDYSRLDEFCQMAQGAVSTEFDLDLAKVDICKLVAEKMILERFAKEKDLGLSQFDDRIFLEARLLVESDYPGVSKYKSRKY